MAQKAYGLSHTKWMCKYHVVFTPKYRRKVIYNQIRSDLGEIFRSSLDYRLYPNTSHIHPYMYG